MSNTVRLPSGSTASPVVRSTSQEQQLVWTDDLPVCHLSGIGYATNAIYKEDGHRREEHEIEDRSFHFRLENDVFLYGVFDGHDGSRVANFAAQRMPAELLLGQLRTSMTDQEVMGVLHQALVSVEKGFFDSIDDYLAVKAQLLLHVPEGMSSYEVFKQYPDLFNKLEGVEGEIVGGTTAVVALIVNNKLYIANIGCSRALLCKTDNEGVLRVFQLTVDHTLANEQEQMRLAGLGLNVEKLCNSGKVGNHEYTRTIGDYNIKSGYKEIELLSMATSEPVIPVPEIRDVIELDDSCAFLILMSDGLYKSLEDATGTERVNKEIAALVAAEFATQATLNGVAQAVVDKVVRKHHDTYMTSTGYRKDLCQVRDDVTLLVRNFNYQLPNAINSPTSAGRVYPVSVPFMASSQITTPLSVIIPPSHSSHLKSALTIGRPMSPMMNTCTSTLSSGPPATNTNSTNDSTQSGDEQVYLTKSTSIKNSIPLDENGRVAAYVDFSDFYKALENMNESEREQFDIEIELKPAYAAIPEEDKEQLTSPVSEQEKVPITNAISERSSQNSSGGN